MDEKAKYGLDWDATVIAKWIEKECQEALWGNEEDWDKVKAYVLTDRSIGEFKSYVTMSGTEDRVCNIFGMTKVPMSLQMVKTLQVLARLCTSKEEAPASLWLTTCEAIERLSLAAPSATELQTVEGNEANLRCIPAETTMPSTTAPVAGHVLPPWHHDLQDKAIAAL